MNMKDFFRILLMTVVLVLVAVITVACSNPRPDGNFNNKTESNFCNDYEMQEIETSDSNEERLRKLRENTYFQGKCS